MSSAKIIWIYLMIYSKMTKSISKDKHRVLLAVQLADEVLV